MTPTVGQRLAGYEIRALIARGGMSTVYRAHDDRLDRDVALKVLSEDLSGDPVFRARFAREWRILAGMRHPNIVPIFDAGEWQGQLYQAMLLVSGADLAQLVALSGPLSVARATAIIGQVAAALDAAHAQGVLHRDVKPSNVIVAESSTPDRPEHVYLVDFGLTRRADSTQLTASGNVLGTVGYMAPEVLRGAPADARSDQYSLACLAYQLLTGEAPFRRSTQMGTIMAQLQEVAPSSRAIRGDIPSTVDQVVARGMAPDADDRYASAGAFAHDLASAAAGSAAATTSAGARASAGGRTTRLAPLTRRHPAAGGSLRSRPRPALAIGVAAVLVPGGLGALAAERLLDARGPTSPITSPSAALTSAPSQPPAASTSPAAPTASPQTAFQRLLAVIPAPLRSSCVKSSSIEPSITGYLVVIQCNLDTPQVLDLRYWLYPDVASVDDEWQRRMAALTSGGLPTADGNCWNGKQGQTTHARGSLQCDIPTDGTLEVRWSDRRDLVYAVVNGKPGDLKALVRWWSTNAVLDGTQQAAP
jgi:Protein kinase domain